MDSSPELDTGQEATGSTDHSKESLSSDFQIPVRTRGRGRGRNRGPGRSRGRGRGSRADVPGSERRQRGGRRGARRGGRRGGRQRTRGQRSISADDQERIDNFQRQRNESIQNTINNLTEEEMKDVLNEFVQRHPATIFDILEKKTLPPSGSPPQGNRETPDWCTCLNCRLMPTDLENLCCKQQPTRCISYRMEMDTRILDPFSISLIMQYRADIFASRFPGDNPSMRHGAFTLYTIWQHKHLGAGNRRVIPSCVVWRIRDRYPEPSGQYVGFQPARLV